MIPPFGQNLQRVVVLGAAATEIGNHNNVKKQCGAWSVYSTQLSPISGKLNWLQYSQQGKEVHQTIITIITIMIIMIIMVILIIIIISSMAKKYTRPGSLFLLKPKLDF